MPSGFTGRHDWKGESYGNDEDGNNVDESLRLVASAIAAVSPITAITTVAAVSAITATTAATATLTRRAVFARTRDVNRQRAALEFLVMEHFHRFVGFVAAGHFDEGEPAGFSRELIEHDVHRRDNAGLGKIILQVVVHGLVGKVAYEEARLIHDTKMIAR